MPGGACSGMKVDGAMREEAVVLAGDHGLLEDIGEFGSAEPSGADHVLHVLTVPARMLDLTGRQYAFEQLAARQVPSLAPDDGAGEHQQERPNEAGKRD